MTRRMAQAGVRVRHVESGRTGTIVGRVHQARTAGNALMVRVRWDGPFKRSEGNTFLRRIEPEARRC
jgi:hypothetical protein